MLNEQRVRTLFEKAYNRDDWYTVLRQNFQVETLREPAIEITTRIKTNDYKAHAFELGTFETATGQLVDCMKWLFRERPNYTATAVPCAIC